MFVRRMHVLSHVHTLTQIHATHAREIAHMQKYVQYDQWEGGEGVGLRGSGRKRKKENIYKTTWC
jgi:hypothetical protein